MLSSQLERLGAIIYCYHRITGIDWLGNSVPPVFLSLVKRYKSVFTTLVAEVPTLIFGDFSFIIDDPFLCREFLAVIQGQVVCFRFRVRARLGLMVRVRANG